MAKITYVDKINNTPLFAERAEYSKGGKNLDSSLEGKIDKVTTATSGNLAAFDASGAVVDSNQSATNLVHDAGYVHTDNNYTTTEKNKLSGIAAGAEVNVQSDWNQTTTTADDYIKNKPENLVQDASYVHTDNNYTTTEKNKLSGIASNAQVNVIETVKVNGTAQTVTSKAVDITVPVAGTSNPKMDGTASAGSATTWSKSDHVHPTDTSREASANKVSAWSSTTTDTHYPSEKLVKDSLDAKAPLASPALTGTPTAPTASAGTNTTQLATTAFVKTAVDTAIAGVADALVYKGTIAGGSTGSYGALTPAADKGYLYKVSAAGMVDGVKVEVGDVLICNTDGTAAATSSNYATIAGKWDFLQTNIDGYVLGPSSSVNAHIATFDGTSGNTIKDSGYTIATSVPSGAVFTDTKVTSSGNHYAPETAAGGDKSASATGATAAWGIDVVKGVTLNTDGKGHVTGISVTSGKIPSNPNTDTKVKATAKTDDVNYKILATASASPTSGNATEAVYDADISLNPSTNTITANISGNAATATAASSAVEGSTLATTLAGKQDSLGINATSGDAGKFLNQKGAWITGPIGPSGPTGATGACGPKGFCGPIGLTGATGPQGFCGPKGSTGACGPQGFCGPKGEWGGEVDQTYSATSTNPQSGTAVAQALAGLDVSSVGGAGKYISAISEADGKISATATSMDTTPTASSTNAVTSGGVKAAIDAAVSSAYHHAGTKTVAQLVSTLLVADNEGNVYNITDSGTTTSDFIEGAGYPIRAGDNVGICNTGSGVYKFDLLSGFVDLSNYIQKSSTAGLVKNNGTIDTSSYLTTSGAGQNVTSTFTKNASDTSGMTSGGKLSALFTAISNVFASLKALAFKDKVADGDISGTISDSHIASASTWSGKQSALPTSGTASTTYAINVSGTASNLAAGGTSGQYLKSNGANSAPSWATFPTASTTTAGMVTYTTVEYDV